MRCPDCNKFVSMETAEPQVDSIETSFRREGPLDGVFEINCSGQTERNCADCGTTLKSCSWDAEGEERLSDLEGWKDLSEKKQKEIIEKLEEGKIEAEINEDGTEANESGGSRYQKNMIESIVHYRMEIGGEGLSIEGQVSSHNAASEFDECC